MDHDSFYQHGKTGEEVGGAGGGEEERTILGRPNLRFRIRSF